MVRSYLLNVRHRSERAVGHLGKLSLSLHWMNLGNQPVEVLVEDVYLLVVPSSESTYDPEEEERRSQAAKFERLENAELLSVRTQSDMSQGQHTARTCAPKKVS